MCFPSSTGQWCDQTQDWTASKVAYMPMAMAMAAPIFELRHQTADGGAAVVSSAGVPPTGLFSNTCVPTPGGVPSPDGRSTNCPTNGPTGSGSSTNGRARCAGASCGAIRSGRCSCGAPRRSHGTASIACFAGYDPVRGGGPGEAARGGVGAGGAEETVTGIARGGAEEAGDFGSDCWLRLAGAVMFGF